MALTKKDIEKLKDVFATKDDLRNELEKYVTKDDLHNELKKYATRDDLIEFKDEIIKRLDDLRTDKLMLISRNREHEESIANHEERIVNLEKKVLV